MYKCLCGTLLLVSLGIAPVFAQAEEAAPDEKTTITLASPHVLPGERAYLTLLLANAPDVSVARLEHWIEFPKSKLEYVSSRLGIAADLAKTVLDVEIQDKPASETAGEETAVLHLSMRSKQPIPDGPLVEVSFNAGNLPAQTITFTHRLEALNADGEAIPDIVSSDGQLEVTHQLPDAPPGIFSCFFYMH